MNDPVTTIVSTKGQVILPKTIREQRRWAAGTRLSVEDTPDGVLLRAVPVFAPTTVGSVFGSLRHDGAALSLDDMDKAIARKQNVVRAVDTNILVRFLTADEPKQARAARRVIEAGNIFVGTTVILETEWVLRAGYGFPADAIASALRGLGGIAGVTIEEPAETALALDWMLAGMDFADALHLARSGHCSAFVTFDKKLAARAKGTPAIPIEAVPQSF